MGERSMKKYEVTIYEIHKAVLVVEAESEEEAILKVEDGEGEEILCEYDGVADDMPFTVKEAE